MNLKVWGDEWKQRLGQLTATQTAPAPAERAWGHPVSVRGDVTIDGDLVQLRAIDIPAEQFVELRTLIPRSGFTSTAGMQVRSGTALEQIAQEEQEDAAAYERDRKRLDDALANPLRPLLVLLALAFLPALAVVALVWWLWGRERGSGYDREYEQEPPTDTEPALVPPLLSQGGSAGSLEFTATLFDLIRRGRYKATPVTTERKIWAGMRTQQVADLELTLADVEAPVESFEAPVASVVDSLVQDGPERLSLFRDRIEDDRTANSERFTDFKSAVGAAVKPWFRSDGLDAARSPAIVLFGALGGILLWQGIDRLETFAPRWGDVLLIAFGVCALVNAVVLLAASFNRRLWRRRAPAAQQEAERWEAFRRYLTDFPRLQEAPPATLAALGALPRLRDRLRHRRTRAAGGAAAHARGARAGQHALLDRPARRPRLGPDLARDRRPRGRLRLGARAPVLRLVAASAEGSPAAAGAAAEAVEAARGEGACARRGARRPRGGRHRRRGRQRRRAGVQARRAHLEARHASDPASCASRRAAAARRRSCSCCTAPAARPTTGSVRSRPGTRRASSSSPRRRRARRGAACAAPTPTSRR